MSGNDCLPQDELRHQARNEPCHESRDAFERLEVLMERLPAMQEKGALLNRARVARRLIELRGQLRILEQEQANYQHAYDTALAAAQEAIERGDNATAAREQGIARTYAELIATRVAPLQRARRALDKEVESGPFAPNGSGASDASDGQLEGAALKDAAFAALEQEIADYQRDFQETYTLCEALNAES